MKFHCGKSYDYWAPGLCVKKVGHIFHHSCNGVQIESVDHGICKGSWPRNYDRINIVIVRKTVMNMTLLIVLLKHLIRKLIFFTMGMLFL